MSEGEQVNDNPRDINELVSWANWQVIEGMTKGEPLWRVMHGVLQGALSIMAEWPRSKEPQQ